MSRYSPRCGILGLLAGAAVMLAAVSLAGAQSSGTGFIAHSDGYILTNWHVVKGASSIRVTLSTKETFGAKLVAGDEYKDVALLKIEKSGLPVAEFGDSKRVGILDSVVAAGFPLGMTEASCSGGQVNAIREDFDLPWFQIDATVNPGNSGGPLADEYGQVVGIVVAKLDAVKMLLDAGTIPERINFAIPIVYAHSLLSQIYPAGVPVRERGAKRTPQDVAVRLRKVTVLIQADSGGTASPSSLDSGAATVPAQGDVEVWDLGGGVKMEMVWIPPGEFMMGQPKDAFRDYYFDREPQHRVTVSTGFWLGKYEVTQDQWRAVMKSEPWTGKLDAGGETGDAPAVCVSWDDAQAFCQRLGKGFRLPSEAEWEYACRAGTRTTFSFGDDDSDSLLSDYAWWARNSKEVGEGYAHRVGQKKPNPWGLFDMHGNVWEWCQDWWHRCYVGAPSDARAWESDPDPDVARRMYRGGSFFYYRYDCFCSSRNLYGSDGPRFDVGFRCARTP